MSQVQAACEPRFLSLLAEFDLDQLDRDEGVIYGLWPDLTLAYMNPAWSRFAADNGGTAIPSAWTLGRCIVDALPEPLRSFFFSNFGRCLQEDRPWEHAYECSSADLYRTFHMTVLPLSGAAGLLVVNSLRTEALQSRTPFPAIEARYRDEDGIVTQCCHCRRTKRLGRVPIWDWVPDWVQTSPPTTSHGVCAACCGYYYAEARLDQETMPVPFSTVTVAAGGIASTFSDGLVLEAPASGAGLASAAGETPTDEKQWRSQPSRRSPHDG